MRLFKSLGAVFLAALLFGGSIAPAYAATSAAGVAVNVKTDFGAKCSGVFDDSTAINKATTVLGALGGGEVDIPFGSLGCGYASTLTAPAKTVLKGQGEASKLVSLTQNLATHIQLQGAGSGVSNLYIDASHAGVNSSGTMIAYDTAANNSADEFVDHVISVGACLGLDINGNNSVARDSRIDNVQGTGCGGIRLGHGAVVATTPVDPLIERVSIGGGLALANPSDYDLKVEAAGGLFLSHDDFLFAKRGTWVDPGLNQQVLWLFCDNSVLGDTNGVATSNGVALEIDTADATAQAKGFNFSGCWASSAFTTGALFKNTGGGLMAGFHFQGLRAYGDGNRAVDIETSNISDISFDDSALCGQALNGIYAISGVSGVAVRTSTIRGSPGGSTAGCDTIAQPGGPYTPSAIFINGTGSIDWVITGDDLHGNAGGAVVGVPTGASVVHDNVGVDDVIVAKASATTVDVGAANPVFSISGTTPVVTLANPGWNGRHFTFLPSAAVPFTTGGNICNAVTATANVPVEAYYDGTCVHLK